PATSTLKRLETTAGLLKRSERAPELFAAVAGDAQKLRRADGTDSLMAIDLVASDLYPGEVRTAVVGLGGFDTSPYSLRALTGALTRVQFLDEEVSANERARQWVQSHP